MTVRPAHTFDLVVKPSLVLRITMALLVATLHGCGGTGSSGPGDADREFGWPEPPGDTSACGDDGEGCAPGACCPMLLCKPSKHEGAARCRAPSPGEPIHWGIHPRASDAFRLAEVTEERIGQTIGDGSRSGGTHHKDGTFEGFDYSAATDLHVYQLEDAQIRTLLERLGRLGFAAWYRQPGVEGWPSDAGPHIHAVYAGCEMKVELRWQVAAWLSGDNGLVDSQPYRFHTWHAAAHEAVTRAFTASESGTHNP